MTSHITGTTRTHYVDLEEESDDKVNSVGKRKVSEMDPVAQKCLGALCCSFMIAVVIGTINYSQCNPGDDCSTSEKVAGIASIVILAIAGVVCCAVSLGLAVTGWDAR